MEIRKSQYRWAIFFAVLAAALYAVSMPLSKILLRHVSPMMMAAFLYIGAGTGMLLSFAILGENITVSFIIALAIMIAGAYLATFDKA